MAKTKLNRDEVVNIWIKAENQNRLEEYAKCEQTKNLFQVEYDKLSEEDKEHVRDYLESIGG